MTQSTVKGVLKVSGVPEGACFTSFTELLQALGNYSVVEFTNQTFSNIVISNAQPGLADRDKIWWRLSNNGSFVGIYFYTGGVWSQVFPAPQQVFWLYGDSLNPPAGFSFTAVSTVFTVTQYNTLMTAAIASTTPGSYVYYPALYVGL